MMMGGTMQEEFEAEKDPYDYALRAMAWIAVAMMVWADRKSVV